MLYRPMLMSLLLAGAALVPSAQADVFVYDVQSDVHNLHVTFELPVFEQTVMNQTTFDFETWDMPLPIILFSLSGGSAQCAVGGSAGPCWLASSGAATTVSLISPLFNGPGAFTETLDGITTKVTITDVPSVPEPSGITLLSSALLAIAVVTAKRRFTHAHRS